MKTIFAFVLLAMFTSCTGKSGAKTDPAKLAAETEQSDSLMEKAPKFNLILENGDKTTLDKLPGKVALILFQPDCDHCQREAEDIKRHIAGFKSFQLYFVSSAPIDEVIAFARKYDLYGHPNVKLGTTTVTDIINTYGPIDAPSIYLYGDDGSLIQSFNGEVAIEVVIKYI